ncbi:HpcH/HpaI aldolase/citrate lyase family protein [Aureimonas pseudogalii]|uniref:Citrate lyase subunit beta/citryl-CoA lyase n=1 Tax=Aureimonas pseudogalii TaxID=1744844 RepID=A0A7W6EE44_9HYPH|nr:CoA ester lyase [Aureimonas pseudogalii]MBB3996523.1 citrate lyase subunit beta/citryl-CoA lyase [Aureimonas pseudogalii]
MVSADPLLRSVLFVPAANPRALARSASLTVDALIFDLEDSAAEDEKDAAREALRTHLLTLRGAPTGPLRAVRINPLDTRHGTEDLLMARGARVDVIVLPKVDGPSRLHEASRALVETDAPAAMRLWAMVETARGVANVQAIADAAPHHALGALVAGPNDLVAEAGLRLSPGRPELMPWLGPMLVAGRAAGIPILDGVYNDVADREGFAAECRQGRALGFAGKTLIHPAQIEATEAAFSPSAEEIAEAEAIVAGFAEPIAAGRGVIRIGARMVERLHLMRAEALLAWARTIAQRRGDLPS